MADEKTLRVSIDGSGAKAGADQVVGALQGMKTAADDVGTSFDRTQSILTQSWNSVNRPIDTVTGSLANLASQAQNTLAFLKQGQSALTQGWNPGPINTVVNALRQLGQVGQAAVTSLSGGVQAVVNGFGAMSNAAQAVWNSIQSAFRGIASTTATIQQSQSALTQGWNVGPINAVTNAISQLSQVASSVASGGIRAASSAVDAMSGSAQRMGQAISSVAGGAMRSMISSAGSVASAIQQIGQAASSAAGSGLRSLTSAINSMANSVGAANSVLRSMSNAFSTGTLAVRSFAGWMGQVGLSVQNATAHVSRIADVFSALNSKLGVAGEVLSGVRSVLSVLIPVDLLREGGEVFFEATNRFQGFLSTMNVMTGSTEKSKAALQNLFDLANKYGVDVTGLTNSFAKLSAAAKGTSLEGEKISHVFEAVVASSSAMHLSTQDTTLVLYALQQMVSKGTVSMEELRRQMSERFPGAMQLAAQSMLMTNAAFQKLISSGQMATSEFIPAFADALLNNFLPATEVSSKSLLAAVNRMKTAWEGFLFTLAQTPLTSSMTKAFEEVQHIINSISKNNIDAVGNAFARLIQYGVDFLKTLDQDKINKFIDSGVKYVELLGNVFKLLLDGLNLISPLIDRLGKKIDDFNKKMEGKDYTANEKAIVTVLTATGDSDSIDDTIKISRFLQRAVQMFKEQGQLAAEAYSGQLGAAYDVVGAKADEFRRREAQSWGTYLTELRDKLIAAGVAADDQVSRMMRQVTPAKANQIAEEMPKTDAASMAEQKTRYDNALRNFEVQTKTNNVQKEYNAAKKEQLRIQKELSQVDATDPANNGRLAALYYEGTKNLSVLLPLQKEKAIMDKSGAKSQDEFTNTLGKFVAESKTARQEYDDLVKGLDKLVPAQREWIHLQESTSFQKMSAERQQQLKDAADKDVADQQALRTLKEFLDTTDKLTEKNDKASASLQQQIIDLQNGEKATHNLAVAEFDRNVALMQADGTLDKLRLKEGDLVDKKLASARASAEAKDRLTEYLEVTKKYVDSNDREVHSLEESTKRLNERAQTLTLTREQQDLNTAALRAAELAHVNEAIAIESANADNQMYLNTLYKKRDALQANVDAFKNMAAAEAAKNFEKSWVEAVDRVSDKFADFLQTGVDQGWSAAFKKLWSDFASWGLQAIAKVMLQKVAISIFPQLEGAFDQGNNGPFGIFGTVLGLGRGAKAPVIPPVDTTKLQASVNDITTQFEAFVVTMKRQKAEVDATTRAQQGLSSQTDIDAQNLADFGNATQGATASLNDLSSASSQAQASFSGFSDGFGSTSLSTQNLLRSFDSASNSVDAFGTSTTSASRVVSASSSFMRLLSSSATTASAGVSDFARSASESAQSVDDLSSAMDEVPNDFTDFSGYVDSAGSGLSDVAKSSSSVVSGFGGLLSGMGGFLRALFGMLGGGGSSAAFAQGNSMLSSAGSFGLSNPYGQGFSFVNNTWAGQGVPTMTSAGPDDYAWTMNGGLQGGNGGFFGGGVDVMGGTASASGMMGGAAMGGGISMFTTKLLDNGRNSTGIQVGSTIGGAIGSIWGPIGSLVGSLIGSLIGSLFNGGGGPKKQGAYLGGFNSSGQATGAIDNGQAIVGINGDNDLSDQAKQTGATIANGFFSALTQLGGSSKGIQVGMGLSTDPQGTAPSFVHTIVRDDAGNTIFQQNNDNVARDDTSLQNEIALQAQRAILAALQSAELPKYLTDLLNSVDASTASLEDIQRIENTATAIAGIVNTLGDALPNVAKQLQELDPTTLVQFVDALGGSQKALSALAFLQQNFTTSSQRAQTAQANLTKAWDTAGVTMDDLANAGLDHIPQTHEEFMKLLDSLDLSTDHGQELASTLINSVAPAFIAVRGSADAAADALINAAQKGIDYYNQHFLTPEQQTQLRVSDDETALYNATREGTKLHDVLAGFGLDVIPTTREAVQKLVLATLAKYGADSEEFKQLMAIIPVIGDLNDATNSWGNSASNAANQASAAADEMSRAWDRINEQNDAFTTKLSNLGGLADQAKDFGTGLQDAVLLYQHEVDSLKAQIAKANANPTQYNQSQVYYNLEPELAQVQKSLGVATARLAEYTKLSTQYGADKAEQLFKLEEQYNKDLRTFAGNNSAISILQQRFTDQWAEIVKGAEAASSSIDDFIKSLDSLVDSSHGNIAQRLTIQLAASLSKAGELWAQMQSATPGSPQFTALQSDLEKLQANNAKLVGYVSDFTIFTAQYGDSIADQLVSLEQWRDAQKATLTSQILDSTQLATALAVVDQIFAKEFQDIVNGSKGAGNALDDLKQKIREFIDSLKTSDLSPLTPQQKLQSAQDLFESDLAKAKGGDTDAMGRLTDEAQNYLKLARDFYASSQAYTDIFNRVVGVLAQISDYQAPLPSTTVAAPPVVQPVVSPQPAVVAAQPVQIVSAVAQPDTVPLTEPSIVDYAPRLDSIADKLDVIADIERSSPNYTDVLSSIALSVSKPADLTQSSVATSLEPAQPLAITVPAPESLPQDYSSKLSEVARSTAEPSLSDFDRFMSLTMGQTTRSVDLGLDESEPRSPMPPPAVVVQPTGSAKPTPNGSRLDSALPATGERMASNEDMGKLAKVVGELIRALADNDSRNSQALKTAIETTALRQRQAAIDGARK